MYIADQTDNIRIFNKCSQNILIESCRSLYVTFYCLYYFLDSTQKATFSKLRVSYNNVFRKAFGLKRQSSASEMFVLNNISNFKALMRKSIFAVTTRLTNSKNATICTIQRSLGYQRHYLESLDRQVLHLGLGYFNIFSGSILFHYFTNNDVFLHCMLYIFLYRQVVWYVLTMGFESKIKSLVSCYLVSCILNNWMGMP